MSNPNLAALTVFEKAKARLLYGHVFWSHLVLKTPIVFTTRTKRAATDMKSIFINPKFANSLTVKVNMFVLAHEAAHIMLKHGLRQGGRKHRVWNWACDFAINLMLKDAKFELWEHCLINEEFRGLAAEQIYDIIVKDPKKYVGRDPGKGTMKFKLPPEGEEPEDDDGDDDFDDLLDPELLDEAEKRALERLINNRLAGAATAARQAGKLPAYLDQVLEGELNPPQPWQALFNDKMTRVVHTYASWSRRNRRYSQVVLPTNHCPGMGPVVFIGDSSGSMEHHEIYPQVGYEIEAMAQSVIPEKVVLIWVDAEAGLIEEFEPGDNIVIHPKGGGGTDMRVGLKLAEQYDPEIVVILTDCETPWMDTPPPYELIVLACATDYWADRVPSWAHVIRIKSAAIK